MAQQQNVDFSVSSNAGVVEEGSCETIKLIDSQVTKEIV
jgi:hypothetical protein